ncbi:hypothetical protein [Kitasatospora sp. NBC_00315]|uniref:aromatic-ring hydroxylase C-terminal domain-containing protein n=1 Tax=Kitasatospora sp. NBC_00315 TaxID=2975963 RepID=UPI00352E83A8
MVRRLHRGCGTARSRRRAALSWAALSWAALRPAQERGLVDVRAAACPGAPAAALLIRPDGYVAWAAAREEPAEEAREGLRLALASWFGAPAEA